MTNEQKIKEACCRANPIDMGERSICNGCNLRMCICPQRHLDGDWSEEGRDICLADVLLAIDKIDDSWSISCFGYFEQWKVETDKPDIFKLHQPNIKWNLRKDSLSDQTEQTKQFIADLLDKE